MAIQLDINSRFQFTPPILFDGVETFDFWVKPSFIRDRPDESLILRFFVSATEEGRPDIIANIVYGDSLLDWVVIAFNNPREIFNWPPAGIVIELPSQSLIVRELI